MTLSTAKSGYFHNRLPYKRSGDGPRPLAVFQGLTFEHKPQAVMLMMYKFLESERAQVPIYLETQTEDNVRLYKHFGFEVVKENALPLVELPMWEMVRNV